MPAYAVDYVACREMLRTKNEMIKKVASIEVPITYPTLSEGICSDEQFTRNSIIYSGIKETDWTAQRKCVENWREEFKKTLKPKHKVGNEVFYTEEGYKWYLSADKVLKDMIKAGCPYG
jgi:DUF438 domain-containing protein